MNEHPSSSITKAPASLLSTVESDPINVHLHDLMTMTPPSKMFDSTSIADVLHESSACHVWRLETQILFPSSTHHVHIDRSWLLSKIRYLHRWLDRPTHPYIFFSVPRSTQVNSYIHHATMNHGHVHTMDMIQNFALWSNSATEVTHMYSLVYATSIPGSPY